MTKKIQKPMISSWFASVKIVIEKLIQAKSDSENSWQSYGEVHKIGWYEIHFVLWPGLAATVAIYLWIVTGEISCQSVAHL